MAEKKIAVAQVIPANYFSVRNRRTNERGGAGSKRATIGIGGKGKGISGGGGEPTGPASRMTGGMADGVDGPPQIEAQQAIASQGRMPRFAVGNANAGVIDLGSILSERANEAFDSSKPIGGDNTPYKATKGIGGFFRRVFGDQSNERNLEAQGAQAADWRREDAEVRKMTREDEIEERRAARAREEFDRRTAIEDARRRGDREYQALDNIFEQARRSDEKQQDIALAEQRRRDELAYRKSVDDANAAIAAKKLALDEKVADATIARNQTPKRAPRYNSLGGGILEDVETSEVFQAREGSPGMGKIPAVQGGLIPLKRATPPPAASANDVPVDPATGQPLRMQQAPAVQPIPADVRQPTFAVMPANNRQIVAAADEMSIDPYELQKLEENPPLNWSDAEEKKRQKMSPAKYLSSGMQQGWRIN
jgi:hypothetical protein